MRDKVDSVLSWLGVEPRSFRALLRVFFLNDLRGQHYTKATGTKSHHVVSPLFWVFGQCLTLSAASSFFLFMRVDVFFFAFVGLALSNLVLATTILVEFNEIVLDPRDLDVIGHRPVPPRTYAAARYANLLLFVGMMFVALNLFPLLLGAGLRDAGPWYAPAYFVASLSSNLVVVALVILILSARGAGLEQVKTLLAWSQMVLVLACLYAGRFMVIDPNARVLVWAADPPAWLKWVPWEWLARFVDRAAVEGPMALWGWAALQAGMAVAACALCLLRMQQLYRTMQPLALKARTIVTPVSMAGTLARPWSGWLLRGPEERAGFWLCLALVRREAGHVMRCLVSYYLVVSLAIVGLGSGRFANPLHERDLEMTATPILMAYTLALSMPYLLGQLTLSADSAASWIFFAAPLARPSGLQRGVAKAALLFVAGPACAAYGLLLGFVWGDPLAALLHAALAWLLSWALALAALAFVLREPPFSRPESRGASLGTMAVPLAAMSAATLPLMGAHAAFAWSPIFWLVAAALAVAVVAALDRLVERNWNWAWRGER